jgi:hypothetical protein
MKGNNRANGRTCEMNAVASKLKVLVNHQVEPIQSIGNNTELVEKLDNSEIKDTD